MTRITIDADLKKKLMNLTIPLELCDEAGQVIAHVMPSNPRIDPDNWEELTPSVSDQEIQQRIDSDEPTYTTQELIDKIKKL